MCVWEKERERETEALRPRRRQTERKSKNGMFLSPATISKTNLNGHSQVFKLVINMLNNVSGNSPISLMQVVTQLQPLIFHSSKFQRQGSQSQVKHRLSILSTAWSRILSKHNQVKVVNYMHTSMFTFHMFILTTGRNIFFSGKFITMYAIQNQCFWCII